MANIHSDCVLILDFGSQYTQLIARRVREANVYSEIHPYDMDAQAIREFKPQAIILSGGPESVTKLNGVRAQDIVFDLNVPVLGICYGMQTMAEQLGGKVSASSVREFGHAQVRARGHSKLLRGIQDGTNNEGHGLLNVWMSHADRVDKLPAGFKVIAATDNAPIAGIADEDRGFYGVQFHPEVTHTGQGAAILRRFIHDIAGCRSLWTTANIIEEFIHDIRERVGKERVLLALSGGVDSSVVAALLHKAIGDQLTCLFVDNGLLRLNEGDQVMQTFARHMGIRVIRVDARQRFLKKLAGVVDPEEKRGIIGREFIAVFEEEGRKLKSEKWLAQGTIYPDVIESAGARSGKAHVIKSHHNVAGLPQTMNLQLIEPLRELFKDEVRRLGQELGLAREIIERHPFPGPGLGVRILGEVKKEYADLLRQADDIFINGLHEHDLYHKVSQAFTVFLPVKSVGVKGDARYYEYVIALRAVETIDFMTARWARLPYEFLEYISNRILNEVGGISRVTYDVSSKPPATIEWE
ncbi:MAG: glutamine-hydrolyzing GMP synthase [Gammaproteobacteria bacterium]